MMIKRLKENKIKRLKENKKKKKNTFEI